MKKKKASIKMQVQFCFSFIVPQAPLDRWLSQCLHCRWAGQLLLQLNIPKSGLVHLWASQLGRVFSWNAEFALQQTCPLLWCLNNSTVDPPDQRTLFYKSLGLCLLSLCQSWVWTSSLPSYTPPITVTLQGLYLHFHISTTNPKPKPKPRSRLYGCRSHQPF